MRIRRSFSKGRPKRKSKKKPLTDGAAVGGAFPTRPIAIGSAIVVTSAVAGYLISALLIFPAPFIIRTQSVPAVVGLESDLANERLLNAGFVVDDSRRERHPTAPVGSIIWQDPPPNLKAPEGSTVEVIVSGGPSTVSLPDVSGYDSRMARQLIEAAGLTIGRIVRAQTSAPRGVAVNTRPPAGSFLSPNATVTLVISDGAPTISVPNLMGLGRDTARILLEEAGLALGTFWHRTDPSSTPETVIEQTPNGGTLSSPGTAVNIVLARQRSP